MAASAASLTLRQIYGINSNVTDNLAFSDDDTVVYVAGHSIVLYNKIDKRQRFISQGHDRDVSENITAFTSGCGKRYAAVAEKGDHPQIHIYDLRTFRKKKTLSYLEQTAKEFISMEFSTDDQYLLTLTSSPDWLLGVWNWNKSKLIASVSIASMSNSVLVTRCSFSPIDSSMICVTGREYIRFFRVTDKELRPLQENGLLSGHNIISHCWMKHPEDHLIAGTDTGSLLLFRSGEYLHSIKCLQNYINDKKNNIIQKLTDYPIQCITSITFGFIIGTKPGTIFVVKFDDSIADNAIYDNQFKVVSHIVFGNDISVEPVIQLAISPNEESVCALTADNQLLLLDTLNIVDHHIEEKFKYLQCSFHGPKSIQGLDVCARKPLIITCCRDNSLRIWNYKTNELELLKIFLEDMYCTSLHPTGLHCAVGFSDKLRVYHILVDDIRVCLEVPIKNCRECKFSKGGNLLAAVNGNSIVVIDFYTGEKIADLRGHNGKVKNIQWLESGNQLLSCGIDGAVYLWDIENSRRVGEFVHKGIMYSSAIATNDQVFAVGSDRMLSLLDMPDLGNLKLIVAGTLLTHVAVSTTKSSFFATTGDTGKPGAIRAYSYPISGDFCAYSEYICMSSQISRIVITSDETFLVVVDELGCIVIMELKDKLDRYQRNVTGPPEITTLDIWTDEILVTKAELEDRNAAITDLKQKVDELKMHNEYQLKLKDMNYSEKIKEVTDKFLQELEQSKTKYELLIEEKADVQIEYTDRLKQMSEKHQHDIQITETKYQSQIMEQVEKYQKLARDRDAQLGRLEDQRKHLVLSHDRYVEELTLDSEKRLEEDRHIRIQFEEEKFRLENELDETKRQLEDDVDTEIDHLRKQFEDKLTTARETTLKYKGENGIMNKKSTVLEKEIEDQKEEVILLQTREKELHDQIKVLEREVTLHKKEIKLRDQSIGEKEKRIYELKKKNQELDKFKFVLDFKIRELKKQIEPRQLEIMAMKDKIKDMDGELDKYHNLNNNLDTMIGTLRERINNLQEENRNTRIKGKQQENSITAFRSDVQAAVAHILSPPALKTAVEHLVELYGAIGTLKPRIDPDVEEEYTRHKEFLGRSVIQLKSALNEETNQHTQTNCNLMDTNMELIDEINKQRESNRLLKQAVQAHIGKIRHLAQSQEEALVKSKRRLIQSAGAIRTTSSTTPQVITKISNNNNNNRIISSAPIPIEKNDNYNINEIDPLTVLEKNRLRIAALKGAIVELESRVTLQKAYSREVLPPMDGNNNNNNNLIPTQPDKLPSSSNKNEIRKNSRNLIAPINNNINNNSYNENSNSYGIALDVDSINNNNNNNNEYKNILPIKLNSRQNSRNNVFEPSDESINIPLSARVSDVNNN